MARATAAGDGKTVEPVARTATSQATTIAAPSSTGSATARTWFLPRTTSYHPSAREEERSSKSPRVPWSARAATALLSNLVRQPDLLEDRVAQLEVTAGGEVARVRDV